jgi:predicted AAA+ superfamily ATPase
VHRYVNLLETTTVLVRLPAFTRSRTKRLVKSPKVFFLDPGLAAFLAGHHHPGGLSRSREIGAMFETLVLLHLRVGTQRMLPRPKLFYWRTVSGREVDFVVESGRKLLALKAKLTPSPRFSDADGLRTFLEEHPAAKAGILVHTGPSIRRLDEKITAVPWWLIA